MALRSFINREVSQVINVRQAMAAAWRRPVPDRLWDYLVEKGHVGEVEEDREPVEYLLDEARQVQAAARSATSPADGNDVVRQAAGVAAAALSTRCRPFTPLGREPI